MKSGKKKANQASLREKQKGSGRYSPQISFSATWGLALLPTEDIYNRLSAETAGLITKGQGSDTASLAV